MRYAIYAAPAPGSALWRFGSSALGYDAATGTDVPFPDGLPAGIDWRALTAEPRRYGFHGTLTAPTELKDGVTERDYLAVVRDLAARLDPIAIPALAVSDMGGFTALRPAGDEAPIRALAGACVEAMDALRAPLPPEEIARRGASGLTERQAKNLERWGYPYVFEDFRFHLTLTGRVAEPEGETIRTALAALYATVPPGFLIDALVVFRQADRAGRFVIVERIGMGG